MTILVIDDDDDVRMIARMSLALGGMTVFEAANGADGVSLAVEHRPDAILLDVLMPAMDGPATLTALRARPETSAIPVIFLTAQVLRSQIEWLLGLGALGVLQKPFDPSTLVSQAWAILSSA